MGFSSKNIIQFLAKILTKLGEPFIYPRKSAVSIQGEVLNLVHGHGDRALAASLVALLVER